MLRDRHPNDKLFDDILQLVPKMDAILAKIDQYLEDEELYKLVDCQTSILGYRLFNFTRASVVVNCQ